MSGKNVKPGAKAQSGSGKDAKPKVATPPKPELPMTVTTQEQPGAKPPIGRHIEVDLQELNAAVRRNGDQAQPGQPAGGSGVASTEGQTGASSASCASSTAKSTPGLAVTSSRDGFWRAGRQWSRTETLVRLSELSGEQVAQLKAEPMLTVADVDHVAAETAGA